MIYALFSQLIPNEIAAENLNIHTITEQSVIQYPSNIEMLQLRDPNRLRCIRVWNGDAHGPYGEIEYSDDGDIFLP